MHSDFKTELFYGFNVINKFSKGGINKFGMPTEDEYERFDGQIETKLEERANAGREGFVGWAGLGGSVFMWHPELKIGFGYVPFDLNPVDIYNIRGKWI